MLILAFESSAKAASVALHDGSKLLAESYQNTGMTHSQTLMVMAEDLLKQCGFTAADVTHVAVAAGPGSFTGVRIGVAAAKGFAWGAQLPLYGVSTLEAMVKQVELEGFAYCACMDARRNQVYNAIFESYGAGFRRVTQDRAISLEELEADLKARAPYTTLLVGDGAKLVYEKLDVDGLILMPEAYRQQRASGVAVVAAEQIAAGVPADAASLQPNYLRLSQAERERLAREQK